MSLLAATQIPKPSDEQAFERASIVLWRGLLGDPNVLRNGRRGQRQNGVDLFGVRNGDPTHHVGIQCKLKSDGHLLTEDEVRREVEKALTFKPPLREYFIITTSADDVALQELARELAAEQKAKGRSLLIYVWGWNTLEERISEDAAARKQFDPDYGAFSEQILDEVGKVAVIQEEIKIGISAGLSQIDARLARFDVLHRPPGDFTATTNALEAHLDADIDEYRDLANAGKPRTAMPLLERLLARVANTASGRILFRIKANIGSCLFALGEDGKAAQILSEAFDHAPDEPKAIANKAFALLLQGRWKDLLAFGAEALRADPTNEGLAGYLVQAARFDPSIEEPLNLIPEQLWEKAAVEVGRIDFLRHRGQVPEWWHAARAAVVAHPDDQHARQFAAEANLDEVVRDEHFQRTRLLSAGERARIEDAARVLRAQWDKERSSEGVLRAEDAALCGNLIIAFHALDDLPSAIEIAREGLALVPDDVDIACRAAVAAIDAHDEPLAQQVLPLLPPGSDSTILQFRFYSSRGEWSKVAELYKTQSAHIPEVERTLVITAGRLAEIKIALGEDTEEKLKAIAADVVGDPRASIVVADFALMEGLEAVSENAYRAALGLIDDSSHVAGRLMVAMHAARRGESKAVADLLDGRIQENRDGDELRTLARAFVNDSPIRRRAIHFFERLPRLIRELPFYLHAEGLLHFNRGALRQAETCLRKAITVSQDLTNYLALFSTLRRSDRRREIKPILEGLDLALLQGTPGQKMYLAQEMVAAQINATAFAFAYDVLQSAKNDPDAALRYFGLMMLGPTGRKIPAMNVVGIDAWVRLEGAEGEAHSFLVEKGPDRPADGVLGPGHSLVAAAMGMSVGDVFRIKAAFGNDVQWRIAEIKHKYLHALHDVMANFQTRFPDAKGLYSIKMKDGDLQPALDQVRKTSESNRKLADLYLLQHLPMAMVASRLSGDAIGFAEYVRSLDHNIETCVGNEPERLSAGEMIARHRAGGAVLDTYTAWTVATMDAFDILGAVFGKVIVPQSSIDELRSLRDREDMTGGRTMTLAWHNGQFVRQVHTREDIKSRHRFISDQMEKIEKACQIEPSAAPDSPSEMAAMVTEAFGSDVLDAAHIATDGYVLISDDLYFRQLADAAVTVKGVWLQPVIAFARDQGLIEHARYVDAVVKLAWRRHSHVSLDAGILSSALDADTSGDLSDFRALTAFIGTKNADIKSHLSVVSAFLVELWSADALPTLKIERATGIILERLVRFRTTDWALLLALLKDTGPWELCRYVDLWVSGHFLGINDLYKAEQQVVGLRARLHIRARSGRRRRSLASTRWPL